VKNTSKLKRPPSRLWLSRSHESVHILEGDFESLDFLLTQRDCLRFLTVTAFVDDLSAIPHLVNLERLILWPTHIGKRSGGAVSLATLPRLRELSVGPRVDVEATSIVSPLKILHTDRMPRVWARQIGLLQHLEVCRLDAPQALPNHMPDSIRELWITRVRDWGKIQRFTGMRGLRYLQLEDIRGLVDMSAFAAAPPLNRLYVEDCPDLTTLDGITLGSNAEYLFVGDVPLRTVMGSRWSTDNLPVDPFGE
jgi:hypothetical protein